MRYSMAKYRVPSPVIRVTAFTILVIDMRAQATATIYKIPLTVAERQCPNPFCAHILCQTLVVKARQNYGCQKCGKHKISEFLPIMRST